MRSKPPEIRFDLPMRSVVQYCILISAFYPITVLTLSKLCHFASTVMVQPKWPISVSVLRCSGLSRMDLLHRPVSRKETRLLFTFPSYSQPLIKSHSETKVVPFSANEMFDVVADVNSYNEFLPFCVESRVLRKPNENVMEAMLRIGFKIFTEAYTSRVIMNRFECSIAIQAAVLILSYRPHKINIKSLESPTFKRIERFEIRG